jgi:hypothetical protein
MNKYNQPTEAKVEEAKLNEPSFLSSILGSIETVTAVPTGKPNKLIDQIKFYSSGATYRLYIYNAKADVWRYTTLT